MSARSRSAVGGRCCAVRLAATTLVLASVVATLGGGAARAEDEPPAPEAIVALSEEGRNEEALEAARVRRAWCEERYGDRSPPVAEALELEVLAAARLHQGSPAGKGARLALAERALEIRRATSAPGDPERARAWYALGLVHNLAGDPHAAVEPFGRAREIVEARFGLLHPDTAQYVREHGAALLAAGRVAEAAELFERHREIVLAQLAPADPQTFGAHYNLAIAWQMLGRLDEAQDVLDDAAAALAADPSPSIGYRLRVLSYQGLLRTLRGDLGASVQAFEEAYATARAELGARHALTASMANNLAYALLDFGDGRRALEVLQPELARDPEQVLPPQQELKLRMNLARALRQEGRLEEARAEFARARARGLEAMAPDDPQWGEFHGHLGHLLEDLGRSEQARAQFELALERLGAEPGAPPLDVADALHGAGRAELRLGNPEQAEPRLRQALETIEEVAGPSHRWFAVREDLAETYWALGERERAFDAALAAQRASTDYDRATLATLAGRQARVRTGRRHAARDVAVAALLAAGAGAGSDPAPAAWRRDAFDATIRARALVFDEMASRRGAWSATGDLESRARLDAWRQARTRLADLFVVGPRSGHADWSARLASARREVERLEGELAATSAAFRARRRGAEVGLDAVQASLADDEALVSYLRHGRPVAGASASATFPADESYAAIVLRPGAAAPTWIDLGPAERLERAIATWQGECSATRATAAGAAGYRDAAEELRRRLWDPVAPHVGNATRVHVVPDGPIHAVAFSALADAEGGYLIESGPTFRYLTAERDLQDDDVTLAADVDAAGLLLVSDPAFAEERVAFRGDDAACAVLRTDRFGPLPGTRAEARAVRRFWSEAVGEPVVELTGEGASETPVRSAMRGRRVVHLATHGYFLDAACRPTASAARGIGGLAAAGPGASEAAETVAIDNPLLLSGLVLAPAEEDDGFLTAEEVGALDLAGTELAVLSACRTGAGRVADGEGVFGLRRAFLLAGAGTVVSSLWDVDDRSARVWIEELYRGRFAEGRDAADAVRAASLHVLNTRRAAGLDDHPFHWAGWIAAGR